MRDQGFIGRMVFMTGGLLAWAVHFAFVYGFTAVACAKRITAANVLGIGVIPFVIGAATLLAWAAAGAVLWGALSRTVPSRSPRYGEVTEHFLHYTAAVIAVLSLVAIAWNALPVLVVVPCSGSS
jgi:hypothetical protein